jgi:tRNA pseudouridine55 synthase
MLPVCLGEATKIAGDILANRKCYRFSIRLGSRTTTGDSEGEVTATAPVPELTLEQLAPVLAGFCGAQRQVPPMYSALKQGGTPLYRLARAGRTVERAARDIVLDELRLLQREGETLELETLCSKGTYVRVLAEDIAVALGTVGHVSALRRLYVEPFAGQPMHTLESLRDAADARAALLSPDWPLSALRSVRLNADAAQRLRHGQRVSGDLGGAPGRVRLYAEDGTFLGIGQTDGALIQPRRLFN